MSKKWHAYELTEAEIAQSKRVEVALCNELNLLAREGIPLPMILTGLGTVIADLITTQQGPQAVAPWFQRNAEIIADLTRPAH
jgi:hypothetical protein